MELFKRFRGREPQLDVLEHCELKADFTCKSA